MASMVQRQTSQFVARQLRLSAFRSVRASAAFSTAALNQQPRTQQRQTAVAKQRNSSLVEQRRWSSQGREWPTIVKELSDGLLSMEKPGQYIITLIYAMHVLAPIRICLETGIFVKLTDAAKEGKTLSAIDLAATLPVAEGAELTDEVKLERRDTVVRILRAMRSIGLVDEVEPFVYTANDLTKSFADPTMAAGFEMCFDVALGPKSSLSEMGKFLRSNNYQPPLSAEDGPVQRALDIVGKSTFQHYVDSDPLQLSRLSAFMSRVQKDRQHWTEWFPKEAIFGQTPAGSDHVFFVDVAGGFGHDLFALTKKYPEEQRKFILQDLPSVISEGKDNRKAANEKLDDRVSLSEHNFFQPQPIKPASIYFMHKIIHDWPDSDCVRILSHLRDAMGPDSRIFVNDMIIPVKDCPVLPAAFDITMLALHSGQERDEDMWTRLVAKVDGLKIKKFWHPPGQGEGIVEIVKA